MPDPKTDQIRMDVPFFQVANDIFDLDLGLDIYEKTAYIYLARCANNSQAFPSYRTIADKCSMSRRKAVYVIDKLIEKDLISKTSRRLGPDRHTSNIYTVNNDLLALQDASCAKPSGGSAQDAPPPSAQDAPPSAQDAPNKELGYKELPPESSTTQKPQKLEEKQRTETRVSGAESLEDYPEDLQTFYHIRQMYCTEEPEYYPDEEQAREVDRELFAIIEELERDVWREKVLPHYFRTFGKIEHCDCNIWHFCAVAARYTKDMDHLEEPIDKAAEETEPGGNGELVEDTVPF